MWLSILERERERNAFLWLKMNGRELQTQVKVEGQPGNVFGDRSKFKRRDQLWKLLAVLFRFRLQIIKTTDEKTEFVWKEWMYE